jgi:WD40 repeat protein
MPFARAAEMLTRLLGVQVSEATIRRQTFAWGATDGEHAYIYRGHGLNPVHTVAWSPNGKLIASEGGDTAVQLGQAP